MLPCSLCIVCVCVVVFEWLDTFCHLYRGTLIEILGIYSAYSVEHNRYSIGSIKVDYLCFVDITRIVGKTISKFKSTLYTI